MSNDNIKEPTDALRKLMKGSKAEKLPGLRTGWQAMNRLFGPVGGMERGKFAMIGGLYNNYKTGLLYDLFAQFCTLNEADESEGLKPLNILFTTETLPSVIYGFLYESLTSRSSKEVTLNEIEATVNEKLSEGDFDFKIIHVDPFKFKSVDLTVKLQSFIDEGYDIHSVCFDMFMFLNNPDKSPHATLHYLKNYMADKNILFVSTEGVTQEAMALCRDNKPDALKIIADGNYWQYSNQIPHIVDYEIFVNIVESAGDSYLHVVRGMGDIDDPAPFEQRSFYLPFATGRSGLLADIDSKDISVSKLRKGPLDVVTNRFKPEKILYESGGFVIASGTWKEPDRGQVENKLACRWHPEEGIGYPNGFGRPQWMNLGRLQLADAEEHKLSQFAKRLRLTFNPDHSEVVVGQWVRIKDEWYLVNYIYGSEGNMVSAMGRGKSGPFPIDSAEIDEVSDGRSTLGIWHDLKSKGDYLVWITPRGALATTKVDDTINQNGNIIQKNIYLEGDFVWDDKYQVVSEHIGYTYMLDQHYLIGKLSGDLTEDELHTQVRRMGRHFAVDVIRDIKDLKEGHNDECRMEDEIKFHSMDVFHGDLVLDAIYYNLTEV